MKPCCWFVALLTTATLLGPAPSSADLPTGQLAPNFSLPDAEGKIHTLSDFRGRIVVLEWTESTSPHVQRHYQEGIIPELASSYADSQVVWLSINSTSFNTPEETITWSQAQNIDHPTLLDSDGAVGQLYEAEMTPQFFIVDAAGILTYSGAFDDDPNGVKPLDQRINYLVMALQALRQSQTPQPVKTLPYGDPINYAVF